MKKIGLFYATKAERTSWVAEKIQNYGVPNPPPPC